MSSQPDRTERSDLEPRRITKENEVNVDVHGRRSLSEDIRASVGERLREARENLLDAAGIDVSPPKPEIAVDDAIWVMNQRNHRDWSDWKFFGRDKAYVQGAHGSIVYSAFDAVAIAEKYGRDGE